MTPTTIDQLKFSMLASNAAAGLARTMAAARIRKWGYSSILDDALSIIGELIANAIQAAPRQRITLHLTRDTAGIRISVYDPSDKCPEIQPHWNITLENLDLSEAHWDDNGGWGLNIVRTLATDSGYTLDPSGGKWVWARLTVPR